MDNKEFYSVKEVAQILGLSADRIYENLRAGHLQGSRLAQNSAWRVPASELERLGASLTGRSNENRTRARTDTWSNLLDIAAQLQSSLSAIDPRHLGVYGVGHHSLGSTIIPQPKLRVWVEQGRVRVSLLVEEDSRFPLFISRAQAEFPQFNEFENWKDGLAELIAICQSVRSEIKDRLQGETDMQVFGEEVISVGALYEAWRFVYEFALYNYRAEKLPEFDVVYDRKRYHLVPEVNPGYVLAAGSEEDIKRCQKAIINLIGQFVNSTAFGEIKTKAAELTKRAQPFQTALSIILGVSAGDN
jgi:excisionase family DNA binding protein